MQVWKLKRFVKDEEILAADVSYDHDPTRQIVIPLEICYDQEPNQTVFDNNINCLYFIFGE